ncbi:MAG: galactonate dehydratase [Chloroflexota bacterium]|nr:MAG: galactonate dehydratase [Chloroflexota bacterium]
MKITNVEPFLVWGGNRNYTFVVVDTDAGISGVGEAGLTWKEQAVAGTVEHLKQFLIGQGADRIEFLWQSMSRGGFFPPGAIGNSAIAAIDIALWDIQGKARGVPVYQLLGGLVRDRVVCYPHTVGAIREELVEDCRRHVAEGWQFVRISVGARDGIMEPRVAVRACLDDFAAIREAIGDDVEIVCDIHTRLEVPDAIRLCRESERFRPFFIEDPLRAESMHAYRLVRAQTAVPLAIGEHLASKWEFRQLIEEELMDYARIDLCIAGGLSESKKIAGWCEAHHIQLALHNPLGPISAAACLHLSLASSNVGVLEMPRKPMTRLTDVVPVQVEWKAGYLVPPTRPGLGVEFDRDAARRNPFQMQPAPQFRRPDGAFTNW